MLSHEELQNFRNLLITEIFICTTYRNNVNLFLGHFFNYGCFRSVRAITYFKRQVSAMSALSPKAGIDQQLDKLRQALQRASLKLIYVNNCQSKL